MSTRELNLSSEQNPESIEKYEFDLPPIKGFPELRWAGKRPFRSTHYYPAQLKEKHGQSVDGWMNEIYWGDNLQVMSHLLKKYRGKVKLIYIDPPFDSKADYKKKIQLKGKTVNNDQNAFEEKQYSDIWTNDEYLQFMYERLILLRELLSDDGVICLHTDWHKNHVLRSLLDEIFSPSLFINELVWHYYNKMQGNINRFASNHDTIFVYGKSKNYSFNKVREEREKPVKQIKRIWSKETQSLVNAKDENGNIIYINSTHRTVDDVWRLSMLQPADKKEPLGYPTQKPETLIERIVNAFSDQNDLVFDCFMGSGTTQAVSMKLGRRFIGADINLGSIQTTTKRLLKTSEELLATNKAHEDSSLSVAESIPAYGSNETYYLGFTIYNVNNYDVFRNPTQAKEILIEALEIQKLPGNIVFDGEKDGRMVKILPINRIATKADLNELISNLDYKAFDKRQGESPGKPVEHITLVCMGHDPDLAASLQEQVPYKLDIEVVDILRDRKDIQFKRDSEAEVSTKDSTLVIEEFFPMNLLQKLSLMKENVSDWREMVESVMIDFNYDGVVFEPNMVDIPDKKELVKGSYPIPEEADRIRIKITDLLSESFETDVFYG